jgi:hypothetical protein
MTTAYDGDSGRMLEDHANRFLCVLYFLARGIKDRSFDSYKVFGKLGLGAFADKEQARAEIIQFLQQQKNIRYDGTYNTVSLDTEGLNWAERECHKDPYMQYKVFL